MKELVYHRGLLPALENHASKTAFFDQGYEGTYEQHGDRVFRLCHALKHQLGVEPGDRFAVMATNSHEFLELYHAAFLGAGVINPLNLRLAGKELDYIVRDSGCEVAFVDIMFADHFARAMAESDEPSPIRHVVLIGDADVAHDVKYDDLIAAGEPVVPDEPEEDDPVVLMYTGGTTGLPKGVLLEHRAEVLNLYHIGMVVPLDPDAVYLHQTPMFHAASMGGIMGTPLVGGSSVFMPLFDPGRGHDADRAARGDPDDDGADDDRHDAESSRVLARAPGLAPVPHLRRVADAGGDPRPAARALPRPGHLAGLRHDRVLLVAHLARSEDHRAGGDRLRSAGRAVAGVSLSIRDENGEEVPRGETGEVCARAGNFMREYWNKPEATEEVFRDGWYHTGDAGYLDDEGYLFLVDRVKDMIVTGGENVYSAEVESALSKHHAVEQVAVIGIPHETWGEQVHAIVVLAEGASATDDELMAFAKEQIAGYKVPKSIEFRAEPLPLSGAMKVLKRELRAPYWEDQDRNV